MTPSRKALLTILKLADLAIVAVSFCIALAVSLTPPTSLPDLVTVLEMRIKLQNLVFAAAYIAFWHFVLHTRGLYRSYRLSAASRELRDLGIAVLIAIAPLVLLAPIYRFAYVTREFLVIFGGLAFIGLGGERRVLRALGRWVRHHGRNLRNVIIVGTGTQALEVASTLARREDLGYRVQQILDTVQLGSNHNGEDMVREVQKLLEERQIDEIFIALPLDTFQPLISRLVSICEQQGITVRIMAHIATLLLAQATVDSIEGQPVLTLYSGPPESFRLLAKRAIDIVGATAGLFICAPLFLLTAVLIKLDSRGPVFFAQERVGLNRRRFFALKFRTMVQGAEQQQAELEPYNEASGPVFKIENDPRVTRVGRFLRKISIDELPQLINVWRGEMSLVGPRPLPIRDVNRINVRWHKRRFAVKPGITCLWQVESRRPEFDEWIRYDMEYIDNWSLALDFKILARTIPAVLSGQGMH